jgi:hypothetical protein
VAHWVEYMNRDTMQAHLAAKDSVLNAELERFMEHVVGGRDRFEAPGNDAFASSLMRGRR